MCSKLPSNCLPLPRLRLSRVVMGVVSRGFTRSRVLCVDEGRCRTGTTSNGWISEGLPLALEPYFFIALHCNDSDIERLLRLCPETFKLASRSSVCRCRTKRINARHLAQYGSLLFWPWYGQKIRTRKSWLRSPYCDYPQSQVSMGKLASISGLGRQDML